MAGERALAPRHLEHVQRPPTPLRVRRERLGDERRHELDLRPLLRRPGGPLPPEAQRRQRGRGGGARRRPHLWRGAAALERVAAPQRRERLERRNLSREERGPAERRGGPQSLQPRAHLGSAPPQPVGAVRLHLRLQRRAEALALRRLEERGRALALVERAVEDGGEGCSHGSRRAGAADEARVEHEEERRGPRGGRRAEQAPYVQPRPGRREGTTHVEARRGVASPAAAKERAVQDRPQQQRRGRRRRCVGCGRGAPPALRSWLEVLHVDQSCPAQATPAPHLGLDEH